MQHPLILMGIQWMDCCSVNLRQSTKRSGALQSCTLEILHKPLKTDPLDFFQTNQSPAHSVVPVFISFPRSKQQSSSLAAICILLFPPDAFAPGVIPANANPVYSCTKTKTSGPSILKHSPPLVSRHHTSSKCM